MTILAAMRTVSWNVNGVRAATPKGLAAFLHDDRPDILCLQETKARQDQFPEELRSIDGYRLFTAEAEKAGYSGVAIMTREEPRAISELAIDEFDREGRTLIADFEDFVLINGYFPNSQAEGKRLGYKIAYCDAIRDRADLLASEGRDVVICGDFNIAHRPIDLARPKANEKNPGYLPEEREWMGRFLDGGYVDTFRHFHQEPDNYTWWSYRMNARAKNIGWRIDYHVVNERLLPRVRESRIRDDIFGSDHCPVEITIE